MYLMGSLFLLLLLCQCGVKGRPMPPLEAPFISGKSHPQMDEQAEGLVKKKK
jgi:hypothetical protein